MHPRRPSRTAAWVATWRGLGDWLPPGERLCSDPLAFAFTGPAATAFARLARLTPGLAWGLLRLSRHATLSLFWVQLRTRAIDDLLLAFVAAGGRQLLLLGAGYDLRAQRLAAALAGTTVFEVDHPATQRHKRARLPAGEGGRDLAFDFEAEPAAALPSRLVAIGHDPARPTFTLLEGVTMYLTPAAIDATVRAVAAASAPGSQLAFEYYEAASLAAQNRFERAFSRRFVLRHEPFLFGWHPAELPAWLVARGFDLACDDDDLAIAKRLLSPVGQRTFAAARGAWRLHLALAQVR